MCIRDSYKGLSVSQIEISVREDTIWNRPSWPLKGNPYKAIEQINEFFTDEFIPDEENNKYFQNKILDENLTRKEILKQLSEKTISCKIVTFKVFGLSLASINTIFSFVLFCIFIRLFKNYEINR